MAVCSAHAKRLDPSQFPSLSTSASSSTGVPPGMMKASSKPAVKRQRPPTPPAPKAFLEAEGGATRTPAPGSGAGS
eukprot:11225572-Lingulodinium_polyedra.AAC.1